MGIKGKNNEGEKFNAETKKKKEKKIFVMYSALLC